VTDQKTRFPEFYVTAPQPCPYLPGRLERKIFTHLTADKPRPVVDNLLKNGFRRSQNIAYMPYCEKCTACVSVRIPVAEFHPGRTMKRNWRRNCDVVATRVDSIPTAEQYTLFRNYIDARHSDGGMADMSVFDYSMMVSDSAVETFITEYRVRPPRHAYLDTPSDWPLIGATLCDQLSDGISMVYSFYDQEPSCRSLGTYMILEHIEYAREAGLPYVYLGYWVEGSRKMKYKSKFLPQERLSPKGWIRIDSAD
jgi:arginyl-tRNA--protein-N-Asp/Glu arginylyltransferase